jgi:hypothetical protein
MILSNFKSNSSLVTGHAGVAYSAEVGTLEHQLIDTLAYLSQRLLNCALEAGFWPFLSLVFITAIAYSRQRWQVDLNTETLVVLFVVAGMALYRVSFLHVVDLSLPNHVELAVGAHCRPIALREYQPSRMIVFVIDHG